MDYFPALSPALSPPLSPQDALLRDRERARLAQSAVAYAFGVPREEIEAPTRRSARAAFARQAAMYLAHVAFELPLTRVALAFGRDRTNASHACHCIEDEREDSDFDAHLDAIEHCLRALPIASLDEEEAAAL
jgi:chromosomal replication initiation ATPase DnaA